MLSQNRYTYVENNPVNYIDPTGHVLQKTGNTTSKGGITKSSSTTTKSNSTPAKSSSTTSVKTTSTAKKTATSVPTVSAPSLGYQKPTYSSGAVKAAQNAKIPAVANSSSSGLLDKSHFSQQPFRKDAGPIPVVIEDFTESAKAFIRNTCNESAQRLKTQGQELLNSASKVPKAIKELWEIAAAINYQEDLMRPQQMLENAQVQNAFVANVWNAAAQMAYENQLQEARNEINSLKATVVFLRPITESMQEWSADKAGTLQLGINTGISGGMTGSVEGGLAMDLQGNIGVYATLGTGYDFSGLWPGKFPTEAKFQWEPLYDRASISVTGVVTVMNAPSLDFLSGGGASFGLSATDAYGVTGGAALVLTGKDDKGNTYIGGSAFFGVNTSPGADFTETCTYTIVAYRNIYKDLLEYYDFIEGIEIQ